MDGKSFALICVLLIAAACVHNSDAFWGRRRRRSPACIIVVAQSVGLNLAVAVGAHLVSEVQVKTLL